MQNYYLNCNTECDYLGKIILGWTRIENTLFLRTGQEGHSDSYDPRYSLAFHTLGDPASPEHRSYVKHCSFVDGFNTAIGGFVSSQLVIEDNVIVQTVGSSK